MNCDSKEAAVQAPKKRMSYWSIVAAVLALMIFGAIAFSIFIEPSKNMVFPKEDDGGFFVRRAQLNDLLQFLAKEADLQYFHNAELQNPDFLVDGHINSGYSPIQEIGKLALRYELESVVLRDTVYVFTPAQITLRKGTIDAAKAGRASGKIQIEGDEGTGQEEGFFINHADLNDVLQFVTKSGGMQYFHNAELEGSDYVVTGHMNEVLDCRQNVEALALVYGLEVMVLRDTIYVFAPGQAAFRKRLIESAIQRAQEKEAPPIIDGGEKVDGGIFMEGAGLNEVFQYIAKEGGMDYWDNSEIEGNEYQVTGSLNTVHNSVEKVEEIALLYGLLTVADENKIYVYTPEQFAKRFVKSK